MQTPSHWQEAYDETQFLSKLHTVGDSENLMGDTESQQLQKAPEDSVPTWTIAACTAAVVTCDDTDGEGVSGASS